jgi:hypothetical protein
MRRVVDPDRIHGFMRRLGQRAESGGHVYFTGGATALLLGWRSTTIDIDLALGADAQHLLRLVPALKEELELNIELASPSDFIPELPGWRDRSRFIQREGCVDFLHYDLYAQALSKVERGHAQDLGDVQAMLTSQVIDAGTASDLFSLIEPELYRYPAIDPPTFRAQVNRVFAR